MRYKGVGDRRPVPEGEKIKKEYNPAITEKMSHQAHKPIHKSGWLCSMCPTLLSTSVGTSQPGSNDRSEVGRHRKQKEDLELSRKPESLF